MIMRLWLATLLVCSLAQAQTSGDREIARKRYEMGLLLFQRGAYADALKELQAAKSALDRPEFDYNIGLCLAKLERADEAADALERFVNKRPNDPEAPTIRRRIAELRAQAKEPPPPPAPREAAPPPRETRSAEPTPPGGEPQPPGSEPISPGEAAARAAQAEALRHPPPPSPPSPFLQFARTPRGTASLALGGIAVATLLTSAITGGLALSNNNAYRDSCIFNCDHGRYDTARGLAITTDVMISIGVVSAVTTIVLVLTRPKEQAVASGTVVRW
jgi:tetratricopeptide (TPR) repeat protein